MAHSLQPGLSAVETNRRRQMQPGTTAGGMTLGPIGLGLLQPLPLRRASSAHLCRAQHHSDLHHHQQQQQQQRRAAFQGHTVGALTSNHVPGSRSQPRLPLPYAVHRQGLTVVTAAARRTGPRAAVGRGRKGSAAADGGDADGDGDEDQAGAADHEGGEASGGGRAGGSGGKAGGAVGHAGERIEDTELYDEVFNSYGAYATSVIVSRAIPDARDGLKPVHRRILYAMYELGLTHNKPFKKCARVVGEVLGKFHPHGDTAVYDTLVRMAQGFAMRETLVDGHGNFGSLDNDPAAAMRYTECRLTPLAADLLLRDLDHRQAVDWRPTFDDSQEEPVVLPAVVPHLLVNGSSGIAVSLACTIPPHNLGEVVEAVRALIADPDITTQGLMAHIRGPDFPTGGEMLVGPELLQAYETGRGSVVLRGKASIERPGPRRRGADDDDDGASGGGRERIVITELPYQVFKSDLVASIAHLVETRQLEGVADVRDESDRTGVRVVVEVRPGANAEVLLSRLFEMTKLETKINFNCTALQSSQPRPKPLSLKEMLKAWLDFRCEVVSRRSRASLAAAQQRSHLVEGFLRLLREPGLRDAVLGDVTGAADGAAARKALVEQRAFSSEQAEAILDRRIRGLTSMEATKLVQELDELSQTISRLQHILTDRSALLGVVEAEAVEVVTKYPDPRRTQLTAAADVAPPPDAAAVLPARPCLLLASRRGFLRRHGAEALVAQNRNTRGKSGIRLRGGDTLAGAAAATDRDELLLFTPSGRAYQTRVAAVPVAQGSSSSTSSSSSSVATSGLSGASTANILNLDESFPIAAMVPLPYTVKVAATAAAAADEAAVPGPDPDPDSAAEEAAMAGVKTADEEGSGAGLSTPADGPSVVLCSRRGQIKRITVPTKISRSGVQVATISTAASQPGAVAAGAAATQDDELGWAVLSESNQDVVVLVSESGQGLLMPLSDIRLMSRRTAGVKAMRLRSARRPNDQLADVAVLPAELAPLLVQGKRHAMDSDAEAEADDGLARDDDDDDEVDEEEEEEEEEQQGGGIAAAEQQGEAEGGDFAPPSGPTGPCLLLVTAHGTGKRIPLGQLARGRRGRSGQKLIRLTTAAKERRSKKAAAAAAGGAAAVTGRGADRVVGVLVVRDGDEVIMASRNGVVVRQAVDGIASRGRYAGSTSVMALDDGDEVVDVVVAPRPAPAADAVQSEAPLYGGAVEPAARGRGRRGAVGGGSPAKRGTTKKGEGKETTGRGRKRGSVVA